MTVAVEVSFGSVPIVTVAPALNGRPADKKQNRNAKMVLIGASEMAVAGGDAAADTVSVALGGSGSTPAVAAGGDADAPLGGVLSAGDQGVGVLSPAFLRFVTGTSEETEPATDEAFV